MIFPRLEKEHTVYDRAANTEQLCDELMKEGRAAERRGGTEEAERRYYPEDLFLSFLLKRFQNFLGITERNSAKVTYHRSNGFAKTDKRLKIYT